MPPTNAEYTAHTGLFAAAAKCDVDAVTAHAGDKDALNARDSYRRRPLMVAPYAGKHDAARALIDVAHLGHVEVVKTLIAAGAPLSHLNNLPWTTLIEAIVLGDGGPNHVACLKALVDTGADVNIPTARVARRRN